MEDLRDKILCLPHVSPAPCLISSVLSFQEYIDAHPETIILDPLPAIRTLLDRSKSYELIRKIEAYMKGVDTRVRVWGRGVGTCLCKHWAQESLSFFRSSRGGPAILFCDHKVRK